MQLFEIHTLSHSTLPHFHFNTAVFFAGTERLSWPMAVCACWPRWASVSKPPELSLSHSSLVTRMFGRFLCFHCLVCCCFYILIFGSTCKFKWFTIVLWCYWFKTLQKSTTKCFFPWFFFPSYLHNLGIFFPEVILPTPQIRWRLRPRHAGRATLDPICYESTKSWLFWCRIFWGSRFFRFFPKIWDRIFGDSMLLVSF